MVSATMLFRTWLRKRFCLKREEYSLRVTTILNIFNFGSPFILFYMTDPNGQQYIYNIYYKGEGGGEERGFRGLTTSLVTLPIVMYSVFFYI